MGRSRDFHGAEAQRLKSGCFSYWEALGKAGLSYGSVSSSVQWVS